MSTQVIIVAPAAVHEWFSDQFQDWDTQVPVESIEALWDGLDNGALSQNSKIVIFLDKLFDQSDPKSDFTEAVATFSSEAAVLIATYGDPTTEAVVAAGVQQWYQELTDLTPGTFRMLDVTSDAFDEDAHGYVSGLITQLHAENPTILAEEAPASQPSAALEPVAIGPSGVAVQPIAPVEPPVQRVASQQARPERKGIILASTSSKGGSGKTTVALCTAGMLYHSSVNAVKRGLATEPLKVVVVDMDTRDGQIGFILGKTSPSALNVFLDDDKSIDSIKKKLIYSEKLGIHALLAPKRARTAELLDPDFYRDVLEKLASEFDVVVCDTSVFYLDTLLGEVVLPMADAVMFVTDLSLGSVYGMTRWLDEVTMPLEQGGNTGITQGKIGVVVNKSMRNAGIDRELLQKAARGATILTAIPLDSESVIAASNFNNLSDIILNHDYISPSYYTLAKKIWRRSELVSPMDMRGDGGTAGRTRGRGPEGEPPRRPANPTEEALPETTKKRSGLFGLGRGK